MQGRDGCAKVAVRGRDVAGGRGGSGGGFGRRCGALRLRGRPTAGAPGATSSPEVVALGGASGLRLGGWVSRLGAGELRCKTAAARWPSYLGRQRLDPPVPGRRRRFRVDAAPPSSTATVRGPVPRCLPQRGGGWGQERKSVSVWVGFVLPEGNPLLSEKPSAKILWECECALAVQLLVKQ